MTTIYIITQEEGQNYTFGANLVSAFQQMCADDLDIEKEEVHFEYCTNLDEVNDAARAENRYYTAGNVKMAAHAYGLETDITSTPVTTKTPATETTVETPEENEKDPKEEIKMTTKMTKGLGKQIAAAILPITSGYAPQLATLKNAYESARDALKKIRKDETDAVQTAKLAYDGAGKGTIERKLAALNLKAARNHKKITVGPAEIAYKTAKLSYDKLVAQMDAEIAEITRGLIEGYAPATAVLNGNPAPVEEKPASEPIEDKPAEEPVGGDPENVKQIIEEEVKNTDFGDEDNKPADDDPAPTDRPIRTFNMFGFGKVNAAMEKVLKTLAASDKYHWTENFSTQDKPDMSFIIYDKTTMDDMDRQAIMGFFEEAKAAPDRYMIIPA